MAIALRADFVDVGKVVLDTARCRIVEAFQQAHHSRFATARSSYAGDRLALANPHLNAFDDLDVWSLFVGEFEIGNIDRRGTVSLLVV